jgi:signal transduction histidine kinase
MAVQVDLNAADQSRADPLADSLPRPRIEYEVVLLYTGLVLSVVGGAALFGWIADVTTLVLPVPGFEPMVPASAIGLTLFGLTLSASATHREGARRALVVAMAVLAIAQFTVRAVFGQSLHGFLLAVMGAGNQAGIRPADVDPVLLFLAAVACWLPRDEEGWRRAVASLPGATMVALALGLLVHSIPTGTSPDPRSAVSAQWALASLVGGLALLAANILRALGGLVVPRQLPWIVGISSSILVFMLWIGVVQSKNAQVESMVRASGNDALSRLTQAARKVPAEAEFALRLSAGPGAIPWDSVVHGVIGVATAEPGGRARVLLARTPEVSVLLDSMAARSIAGTTRIVALAPPGTTFDRLGLEVTNPHDPREQVFIVALADSVFEGAFVSSQAGMLHRLVQGPLETNRNQTRQFLRSVRVRALTPNTWLETWPSGMLLLSQRSVLPELLLIGGLGLAVLAASALAAALRSRHFEESVERRLVLEAIASGKHPRFKYEWDMATGRVIRDAALAAHLGYGEEFRVGDAEQWMNLIAPSERNAVEAAYMAHAAGRTDSCLLRYHVRAADGTWGRWAERSVISERTPDGRPKQVSGEVIDLGPTGDASEVMTTLEQRLERAAGQAVDLQALFGPEQRLLIATPEFHQYLEGEDEHAGTERLRVARPEDRESARTLWLEAERNGRARGDVRLSDARGRVSTMEMALTRIAAPGGSSEMLLQMRDVTGARTAERRHLESQRLMLLGRLAGRVAHEINNPLGGLSNAAALLRRMGHNAADRERYVDTMEREVQNIAHVVRQLYETLEWGDTSRLEASVPEVVRGALDSLTERYGDLDVWQEIAPEARLVAVPEAVLRLVMYTVLRNALHASNRNGRVQILGRRDGDDVIITVDDRGPDITPAGGATVRRAAPARGRVDNRADLAFGVPFAREVLEVFDGVLEVEDATENGGTAFTTRWPVSARPRRTLT